MGRPSRTEADRVMMRQVGTRLRWVREILRLTQQEIAERVGLHQTAWSLYERGLRLPDQLEAYRLAGKLGITVGYMLNGDLTNVEAPLAIRLAARHPELVEPSDTASNTDKRRA